MNKKVYLVKFDWACNEDSDIEINIYSTYKKAYKAYQDIIKNEMNPELSWVGSCAFDKDGNLQDFYEFDETKRHENEETEIFWCVSEMYDYINKHSYVALLIKEMQ